MSDFNYTFKLLNTYIESSFKMRKSNLDTHDNDVRVYNFRLFRFENQEVIVL